MIYRVTKKTTGSVQPGYGNTFWNRETLYCGTDLTEACIAYLAAKNGEYCSGYGNRAGAVAVAQFEAEPEEIEATNAGEVEEADTE